MVDRWGMMVELSERAVDVTAVVIAVEVTALERICFWERLTELGTDLCCWFKAKRINGEQNGNFNQFQPIFIDLPSQEVKNVLILRR